MKIGIAAVNSYSCSDVGRGLREAVDTLGGWDKFIKPGERVLLKPNMLDGMPPQRAVTTHPEVVRAAIRQVREVGAIPMVGDSPGTSGTLKAAEKCGILAVCQEEKAELVVFDSAVEFLFPQGETVKRFMLAEPLNRADKVISLAKMKTHTFMGITGAAKNLFGFIVGMQKAQFHLRMQARQEFAAMLADLTRLVAPTLSVVDGVVGMEGNGPRNGKPVQAGVIMAGENPFAVDVVMAAIMGLRAEQLPLTALALKRGYTPPIDKIDFCGSGSDVRHRFIEPKSMLTLEDRVPGWAVRLGRRQLIARPRISDSCISCGRCVSHCPPQAMKLEGKKVEIDTQKCINCYCCQELCPADAVCLEEGLLLRLARRFL